MFRIYFMSVLSQEENHWQSAATKSKAKLLLGSWSHKRRKFKASKKI